MHNQITRRITITTFANTILRRVLHLIGLSVVLIGMVACTPVVDAPEVASARIVKESGSSANVTRVLKGDVKNKPGATELWCVETDGKAADGISTRLFIAFRQDNKWAGEELTDGEYQWDLYGCPRD